MANYIITNATGHELDKFVNNKDWSIRRDVAIRGREKDLDILVHDKELMVRKAVARHGRDKDLDLLVRDNDHEVRMEVAKYGRDKDLDILVYDQYAIVRKEVAKHSRNKDLEILKTDRSKMVTNEVHKQMELKKTENVEVIVPIQKFDEVNSNARVYKTPEVIEDSIPLEFNDIDTVIKEESDNHSINPNGECLQNLNPVIISEDNIPPNVSYQTSAIYEKSDFSDTEPQEKPTFKTRVTNFFSKLIKKGK